MISNNIYAFFMSDNLTELRWLMSRRKLAKYNKLISTITSLLQRVKRSKYQSKDFKFTNEPIPTIKLPENHGGDDKVTLMFLL